MKVSEYEDLKQNVLKYLIIISNVVLNDYLLYGNGWNKAVGAVTRYVLDGPRLKFREG
jgi:hypothetical protein